MQSCVLTNPSCKASSYTLVAESVFPHPKYHEIKSVKTTPIYDYYSCKGGREEMEDGWSLLVSGVKLTNSVKLHHIRNQKFLELTQTLTP